MRCYVTGATGFVGGHLVERLAAEGHEVMALARSTSDLSTLKASGAKILVGEIAGKNVHARHAKKVDVVFHLAGLTKAPRPRRYHVVNADGTEALMEGLHRGDFNGRIVMLSSLAAGGPADSLDAPRTEEHDDRPVSEYGRSKLDGEAILQRDAAQNEWDWTILRPGAIYGPRERDIYEILKVMEKSGFAFRVGRGVSVQMTHVEDVVEALLLAADKPESAGRIYHVSDRQVLSMEEIIRTAAQHLKRKVRVVPVPMFVAKAIANCYDFAGRIRGRSLGPLTRDKIREIEGRYWICDSTRIEQEFGWKARWTFADGLRETVCWYREHDWLKPSASSKNEREQTE